MVGPSRKIQHRDTVAFQHRNLVRDGFLETGYGLNAAAVESKSVSSAVPAYTGAALVSKASSSMGDLGTKMRTRHLNAVGYQTGMWVSATAAIATSTSATGSKVSEMARMYLVIISHLNYVDLICSNVRHVSIFVQTKTIF